MTYEYNDPEKYLDNQSKKLSFIVDDTVEYVASNLRVLGATMRKIVDKHKKENNVDNVEVSLDCKIIFKEGKLSLDDICEIGEIKSGDKSEKFIQSKVGVNNMNIEKVAEEVNSSMLVKNARYLIDQMTELKQEGSVKEVGGGFENLRKLLDMNKSKYRAQDHNDSSHGPRGDFSPVRGFRGDISSLSQRESDRGGGPSRG